MGGKHKVANRTKNNARPSSSGRSAELLGSSMPQFVGFTGIKDTGFSPGFSLSNPEELDPSIDLNFQLVLKKITKKDSRTKIKGLQEFADLVKTSDSEAVKAVLPLWPRFYNVLATDTDNRVREATHMVHHQIVLKVKRNIAPFLKQLMAPWFTSQYDTYPPAASVALQAFGDAFPPNKFQEAIVFCQEEILLYINNNLLLQTAETLSSSKNTSTEEAEAKYERVLISCLQGYFLYLTKVPAEQIKKVASLNNDIISNNKFWKLAKHKVPPIRSAWFKVLAALCQKAVFLLDGKGTQVTAAVFSNLEESEPTVLPYVWESALLIMSTIKDWWTFVNVDKLYLPQLWKILRHGGQGNATVIYPNLLPILSHLPPSIEANANQFYHSFFENLQLGLKQKSVISSRSESAAVATALMECLQYVVLKNQSDENLCKQLIKNHVISTVEWCLLDNQPSYKTIFNQVAFMVQCWSRNQSQQSVSFLQIFFDNVNELFRETLYNRKDCKDFDLASVASRQIEFLQSLKHTTKPKKQGKVKFTSDDNSGEIHPPGAETVTVIPSDVSYFEQLNVVAYNICEDYVQYIEEKQCLELFEHLHSLVVDFNTEKFFVNMLERMKKKNENAQLIDIYNILLFKWLKSCYLCSKHVVDLVFLLFKFVPDEDKKVILKTLTENASEDCLGWCISEALSFPYNKNPLVQSWLRDQRVSKFLVSIAEKEIRDECSAELSILFKLALTENEDGELYIQKGAVEEIIQKLIVTVLNENDYLVTVDTCSSLAAYISAIIYTDNLLLNYGDTLLLALFQLSCKCYEDPEVISTETLWEVNTAWQDAVAILSKGLSKEQSLNLTKKISNVVETEFLTNALSKNNLNHFTAVIVNYLRAIHKSIPLSVSEFLNVFLERSFLPEWKEKLTGLCMIAEYVKGDLCSPYQEVKCNSADLAEISILRYFVWSYMKLMVVSSNVEEDNVEDEYSDDEYEEEVARKVEIPLILNVLDANEDFVAQILYDLSLGASFLDNYKNTKQYEEILQFHNFTKTEIKSTLLKLDESFSKKLKTTLTTKALNESWFWCKSVFLLYSEIKPEPLVVVFEEIVKNSSPENNLGILHLTQIFGEHLSYDQLRVKLDTIGSVIVLRSLLQCVEIDVQIAEVFGKIEYLRNVNTPQFLYDNVNITWEKSQEIIEIIRLCSNLMKRKYSSLTRRHWDFAVLSLVSWSSNCLKARSHYDKYQIQGLLTAVVDLFINTDNQIKNLIKEESTSNYISEWQDLFVESIHSDLAQLWLYLAEQLESKQCNLLVYLPLLQEFGAVVRNINHEFIFKFNDSSLPKWTKFLKRSCSLLISPLPTLQLWGYRMLLVLVPGLVKIDTEAVDTNTPHKKGLIFEQFKEKLGETHEIVNAMLEGFKLGEDSCRVKPSTDSFTYTFAYLLLWDVLMTLCEQSSTELRYLYAEWLRNEDLLKNFLNNIFRLMPSEVLHYSEGKSKSILDMFLEKPILDVNGTCSSEKIEFLVCWLYASTLAQLPALVRQWWTGIETRVAEIVEKVTALYVSPHLCNQELTDVIQHQTKFKNMVVKVIPSVREVIAIYTVDEAQMELVITLPGNYPLGGPNVQCNRQIGGTTHKQWLLRLKKCVLHQNGRIWDGLSIWNNNLDKKFDGVEGCYICFAVLHPGTYQLPKLSCQTCKKKFHSACLYKWFSISNKSSCPTCRNLF